MKIKYHELEDDGYISRTTFTSLSALYGRERMVGKGWHSPRIGRTKPSGHILKFSMTEQASSYFIVSRFHRKFKAATRARPDRHFPSGRVLLLFFSHVPLFAVGKRAFVRYIFRVSWLSDMSVYHKEFSFSRNIIGRSSPSPPQKNILPFSDVTVRGFFIYIYDLKKIL